MNPDEAERHLMNGSRATKLALHEMTSSAPTQELEIAGGVWLRAHDGSEQQVTLQAAPKLLKLGVHTLEVEIWNGTIYKLAIPYDLVETVWPGNLGRTNVLLSVRIIIHQNGSIALAR